MFILYSKPLGCIMHMCLGTGHSIPPFLHPTPFEKKKKIMFFFHFWLHQSTDMYIEMPFSDCISDTYQSTDAIRKRHIIAVLHISKPWKWKKNINI